MQIAHLDRSDSLQVARLHKAAISNGFLSSLNERFLARLYEAIAAAPGSWVFVTKYEPGQSATGSTVAGFIAGTMHTGRMYRHILKKQGLKLFWFLIPDLVSTKAIRHVAETLLYGMKCKPSPDIPKPDAKAAATEDIHAELLSIAVDPATRGKGVGKKLIAQLEKYFREAAIAQKIEPGRGFYYKVATDAKDKLSNAFYLSAKFEQYKTFLHHGKELCEYRKKLNY